LIFSADEPNTYNILKVAGSMLGFKHTEKTIAKMSEIQKSIDRAGEKHPMFGRTGDNNPMFGKTGEKNPMFGKTGENHPKSKKVFVYSSNPLTKLEHEFASCKEAAKYFNCSKRTLSNYVDKNKLYKKQWILYSSEQNKPTTE
jgi:group I intron endonuclease